MPGTHPWFLPQPASQRPPLHGVACAVRVQVGCIAATFTFTFTFTSPLQASLFAIFGAWAWNETRLQGHGHGCRVNWKRPKRPSQQVGRQWSIGSSLYLHQPGVSVSVSVSVSVGEARGTRPPKAKSTQLKTSTEPANSQSLLPRPDLRHDLHTLGFVGTAYAMPVQHRDAIPPNLVVCWRGHHSTPCEREKRIWTSTSTISSTPSLYPRPPWRILCLARSPIHPGVSLTRCNTQACALALPSLSRQSSIPIGHTSRKNARRAGNSRSPSSPHHRSAIAHMRTFRSPSTNQ